jgi:fucose 4-O-acetylase-like acetyltransferase
MSHCKQKTNMHMCVLQAIGIFMMVEAHTGASCLDIGGLFQYYSFHMPLFVFISGYLYSAGPDEDFRHFAKRKFMRLMLPYLIWNLLYGLCAAFLATRGVSFGEQVKPLNLYTLFIAPFTDGYQFILNHTAWFIPAIFLEEMFFYPLHRLILSEGCAAGKECLQICGKTDDPSGDDIQTDGHEERPLGMRRLTAAAVLCTAAGCAGIAIGLHTDRSGCLLMLARLFFMLPFFFAGWLYRTMLEEKDDAPSWLYLGICLMIALILTLTGNNKIYSLARCTGFPGYLVTYIITLNGIAFWLRISRVLTPAFAQSKIIEYLGRHTYPVVMHHMPVLFMINTFYAVCASTGRIFGNFDFSAYQNDIYYIYFPRGMHPLRTIYILAMILVPVAAEYLASRRRR